MSNYLNQLKETYKSMRQSPDHGAASNHKVLLENGEKFEERQQPKNKKGWLDKQKSEDCYEDCVENLTLEDIEWGARAALLELNYDDPVLCENIKRSSNDEVVEVVFEVRSLKKMRAAKKAREAAMAADAKNPPKVDRKLVQKHLDSKVDQKLIDELDEINNKRYGTKKLTQKQFNKRANKISKKIDKLEKQVDKLDVKKQKSNIPKGMSTSTKLAIGALTVAAVTAIGYGIYKYLKKKQSKAAAAQAAADKSEQLAKQAKSQGKDKAAAQASKNAKNWKARAKKYKAKGE